MANAKFDPVAQYPDYQPGAGSMLMKSLLAIQAHKDEQARQAALDKAHLAEQQSIQQQREQQMQEALIQHTINMHALEQKTALDQEIANAAGKVGAAQAQAAGANRVANTQAAADMHGNAAQAATDMHGATTQALADMHGAGTQANADTNAANIAAAATPAGEGAPSPKPAEVTPPPEPPTLPGTSFFDKLLNRQFTLPTYNSAQMDAIEKDALAKKVAETHALAGAKESTVDIVYQPDGTPRVAKDNEVPDATVPIHSGVAGLFNPRLNKSKPLDEAKPVPGGYITSDDNGKITFHKTVTPGAGLVAGTDSDGNPAWVVKGPGSTPPQTSATKNRQDQAVRVLQAGSDLLKELDQPETQAIMGGKAGTVQNLKDTTFGKLITGGPDEAATHLAGSIASVAAFLPILHGMRGGDNMVAHFENVIGKNGGVGITRSPKAVKAAVTAIMEAAQRIKKDGGEADLSDIDLSGMYKGSGGTVAPPTGNQPPPGSKIAVGKNGKHIYSTDNWKTWTEY